ncbi:hypothetical protein JF76_07680 [Lactobacillus kullabergensis]|uniref:Uncharacterized protein n=1 Tax=Lactobacillus kullabergensis TaxID=1218493 RepID=A0A0F4LD05_9LACO|nr:hypothetical protein [Lactobacillus kullabergensis]KJY56159.1 hypothetical protein JF76_07680 [Lactobacillus kullabergensis]
MAENKETKGFIQVYKSTNTVPCEPWFAPADAEIAYPFVKEAPDPKLKSPKYDWNNYRWYETDGAVQGQQLAEIAKQVNQLKDDVANGKVSDEALNQQLGTLVGLVSQGAIEQQASQPSKDDKADSAAKSDGGDK